MAGKLIVDTIDTDNAFITLNVQQSLIATMNVSGIYSNTGVKMIGANGTVSNTAITGNIISSQITSVANTQITGNITSSQITSNPTLYGNVSVTGQVTSTGGIFKANGAPSLSAAAAGEAILAPDSGNGALLYGRGTNYDVAICQRSTAVALGVLAGSTNVYAVGDVFIKRTTTYSYANGGLCAEGTSGNPCIVAGTAGTSSYNNIVLGNGNGNVGSIVTNGSATAFNTSSDYRLKENITPMTGALVKVAQLKPVTYKWKVDGAGGEGFIAHELAEVCPHAVSGEKDAVDENGHIKPQGIDVSFLVATLTAAIQEQQAIISDLKARIEALEA